MCFENSERYLEGSGNKRELRDFTFMGENSQIRPKFLTRTEVLRCSLMCIQPFLSPVFCLFWVETSLLAVE